MPLSPYFEPSPGGDTAFTVEAPKIKFGRGSLREVGADARALGMARVALMTDPVIAGMEAYETVSAGLREAGVEAVFYDGIAVEPTDASFKEAAAFATSEEVDGFISLGGGSTIDTAKAANLYSTYPPDDFLDYVNAPIGAARAVPGALRPHIACPTTFGTASECTGIAVFDLLSMEAKTGIASPRLRPSLGVLDPDVLATLPRLVLAANGFDVFSHAFESLTARPYTRRPAPNDPGARPLSQGANPYSDMACLEAIKRIGTHLTRAVQDPMPDDYEGLMFAGMLAGIGFGNAGCHAPHAMSYAVAGLVRDYHAEGWPTDHAMVPHGISVIVNAPAVFRTTGPACPERHLQGAIAMGAEIGDAMDAGDTDAGGLLARQIEAMMLETGIPNGLEGVGYTEDDVPRLVEKAAPQRRLLDNAPCKIDESTLYDLFNSALRYW